MTENEAIEDFEAFCKGKILCVTGEALGMVRDAIEENKQYRAIGTVEEFKALKDDTIPIIHGKAELEVHDKQIRAKAIDEFAEALYNKSTFLKHIESDDYGMLHFEDVYEVAEQMKGDGEDE